MIPLAVGIGLFRRRAGGALTEFVGVDREIATLGFAIEVKLYEIGMDKIQAAITPLLRLVNNGLGMKCAQCKFCSF